MRMLGVLAPTIARVGTVGIAVEGVVDACIADGGAGHHRRFLSNRRLLPEDRVRAVSLGTAPAGEGSNLRPPVLGCG